MNGRNIRWIWTIWATASVLASLILLPSTSLSQESAGRRGTPGRGLDGGVANFSALSEQEKKIGTNTRSRVNRPQSKPSRKKPSTLAGTPTASVSGGDFTAASLPTGQVFTPASGPPSPPASASFQALLDNAEAYTPDAQGAVGTNHIVTMLASQVRIHDRSGTPISTVSLDTFWGTIGNSNVYDPRLIYDSFAHRWVACAVAGAGSTWSLLVGVSQTGDPTGNWFRREVPMATSTATFPESPNLGLTRDWITIQLNNFATIDAVFFSSEIRVFDKANLYAGGPAQFTYFPDNNAVSEVTAAVPAVNMDNTFGTNFLVANWVGESDGFGYLRLYSISGPVGSEVFNDYGTNGLYVTGAPFGNPPWDDFWPSYENFAPQQGTTEKVYLGDARIQNVVYRNSALWCAHHVYLPAGGAPTRSAVQWWSFTTGGSVLQRGRMDDASNARFYAYPSMAVNQDEDVLIGYSRFAGNQFPSANYAFHGFEDAAGALRADTVLKAGDAKFFVDDGNGLNRWGDWSATVVDPVNGADLWTIQEFASFPVFAQSGLEDRWGTWWGRIGPPVSLTVTASDSPDPVLAGGNVTYSIQMTNNFSTLATGARIVNTLPQGATFVSAVSPQGACLNTGGVVTCSFGDLDGNVGVTATIVAQLNQSGTATNIVAAVANGPDEDNPLDNTVRLLTTVNPAADIRVALAMNPAAVVTVGNTLTAVVTVSNAGPSTATAVFMTNRLPANVTYISTTSSGAGTCSQNSGVVTCNLGAFISGASVNVTILSRPNGPGQLTNRTDVVTSALDPALSNNSTSAVLRANASPVLQAISSRTINEDSILGPITNTVSDLETAAGDLVVVASSSNQSLVPNGNIVLGIVGGTGGSGRTITIAPAPNANGSTLITRIVTDADGASATNSFTVTVLDVNDPPTISDILNVTTDEDSVIGPISFAIGDIETPNALTLSGASSLSSLIPNGNIRFGTNGTLRTVTLTPATNQFGTTTITITVGDGATTAFDTFNVTVSPVNDLPTISDITNRVANEDAVIGPISFTVGDLETAAAALQPGRISSNSTLVPEANIVFGGSGANRSVTVTPAANQFGTATITVLISDADGGATNDTFVLTVNPVNDPPTLAALGNISINEDAGLQTIGLSNITAGAANEVQTNHVTATSSNPGLVPNPEILYTGPDTTGTLSFTPTANSNGVATITVTVNDQGSSNNILVRTFTVNVLAVNDPPSISALPDRVTDEDTSTGPIAFSASDIDSSLASLSALGSSSNPSLVPDGNIVVTGNGANWTLNVTPASNQSGTTTVTVFITDGAATNSESFVLTVLPINDPPTISALPLTTVNEDTTTNLSFTIADLESDPATLTVSAVSSNPGLLPSLTFAGAGSIRTLNLVPVSNESGSATVTVTVLDPDNGSNSSSFTLVVQAVNDPPTLNPLGDLVLNEDDPQQTVALTGLGSGAPNEAQALQITVSSDRPSLFSQLQALYDGASSSGSLRLTPALNSNGVANITVFVSDGLATSSDSFSVTINPINDAPSISSITNRTIAEDTTASINFTVGDAETAPANLVVQVDSSNSELLDSSGISLTANGAIQTLLLTPLADQFGSATLTVTVMDTENEVATVSFELTVESVNDLPSITGLTNVTVTASTPIPDLPFAVSDAETLPGSLQVQATSSNPSLLPNGNISVLGSGTFRTLRMTAVPGQLGSATIQVVVRDGAGAGAASATNSFVLTLLNDRPTLNPIAAVVADEDSGALTVTLTGITSGAPGDGQAVTVRASSSNPAFVPDPAVSYSSPATTALLTLTPRANSNGAVTITVTVDDAQANDSTFSRQFIVTVNPIEDPPTLSAFEDRTILEDATFTIPVTLGDVDTLLDSLQLLAVSSNTNLVGTNQIVFTGTGGNRIATITPVTNQHGSAEISIFVRDTGGSVVSNQFTLNVLPVNDPPRIAGLANTNMNEDLSLVIPFTVSDPEQSADALMLRAASSDPALLPIDGILLSGTSSNRTVTLTPRANQTGSVTVILTLTDSQGAEATNSFVLLVNGVNDLPTLTGLPGITINEDNSSGPLPVTVGDLETALSSLALTGLSSNTGLVPNANVVTGGSGANRTVTITPAANQSGTSTITLTLSDGNGGNTNATFLVTVAPVNDLPTLTAPANLNLSEDSGLQSVTLNGISAGPGESQALQISAVSSNPVLIPHPTVSHSGANTTGSLTFTPVANGTGLAVITVTVNDGQAVNSKVSRSFTVSIGPSNDGPTISDIVNQQTNEDTPLTIPFTIDDPETAPFSLLLSATSTNTALVANTNIFFNGSDAARQVTIVPTVNQSGTTLITLRVTDGVATNSDTFLVTVVPVNDFPTLSPIGLLLTNSAGGNPVYTVNLSGISSGATNESQTLLVRAFSSNPSFLPSLTTNYTSPNATGTLTIRPANNATGTGLVSVVVSDGALVNQSVTQTFLVAIRATANIRPTISSIANQTMSEDAVSAPISFSVRDEETTAASLVLQIGSSNPGLLPANNVVVSGGPTNRTLTLAPLPDQTGTAAITLIAIDAGFGASNITFNVTVNPVNDLPTVSTIAAQTLNEGASAALVNFTVSDVESPAANLVVSATSGNQVLIPNSGIVVGGSGANRALTITPALNQSGSTTITVTVNDGTGSANRQFTVTVNAGNDAPTISQVPDQSVDEDVTTGTIAFSIGDPETPAANLSVVARSSNTNLVPDTAIVFGPTTTSNRTLTISPAGNQSGTATITLTVSDGTNQTSDVFDLTVLPVNDTPTLAAISDRVLNQNAPPQSVALTGIGSGAPDENQTMIVTASSSEPSLIPHPAVAYGSPGSSGTLTFTPSAGRAGTATITVTVNDAQSINSSITRTFSVSIRSAPVISPIANRVLNEDTVSPGIAITVSDNDNPAASIQVTARSSNSSLFPAANLSVPGTGGSRSLVITPAADQFGFATIIVTASDPEGNMSEASFLATVRAVNDAPTLDAIGNVPIPINSGLRTVSLTGISSGPGETQSLILKAVSSNPSLIPDPVISYTSPSASGSLTFTPAAGSTGSVLVTVSALDDGSLDDGGTNQFSRTFTVVIGGVGPALRIEPAGSQVVVSWPTNDAQGWTLVSTANLLDAGGWSGVATTPVVVNGRYTVTNGVGSATRLYRLCNDCLSIPRPARPTLQVRQVARKVTLSWPAAAGNFVIESTTTPNLNASWTVLAQAPGQSGGQLTLTLDSALGHRFYRLRNQ